VLTEAIDDERTIRQAERFSTDSNMILNLPYFVSFIFTTKTLPAASLISPIRVKKRELEICAVSPAIAATAATVNITLDFSEEETSPDPHQHRISQQLDPIFFLMRRAKKTRQCRMPTKKKTRQCWIFKGGMMLITAYRERQTRHHEKIQRLLNFLKEETYSDFKTLMLLFGFRDYKSLYSLLSKVEGMGLIQKHVLVSRTMKISLWAITSDGLAVVLTPDDALFPARFEPSKITGWTLEHHLDNQAARIKKAHPDG